VKFKGHLAKGLILWMSLLLFGGCGGGGGGGGTPPPSQNTPVDTSAPAISGFDFALQEGDFWEYEWDYEWSYHDAWSSSSAEYASRFRITLGVPIEVNGILFYEMILSGTAVAGDRKDFTPAGKYLAVTRNQIITLEADGVTQTVIFDAAAGAWPGSGFFTSFPSDTLFEATLSTISNDYINEAAYQVSESASSSNCQYFPGVGTICGGDYDETLKAREYYIAGLGPVGLYTYSGISDSEWSSSSQADIGLTASSLRGDTLPYLLEVEPNNQIDAATPILLPARIEGDGVSEAKFGGTTAVQVNVIAAAESEPNDSPSAPQAMDLPAGISGDVMAGDPNTSVEVQASPDGTPYTTTFEDWYEVTLGTGQTLNIQMRFPGTAADLDMYLFSLDASNNVTIHANSVDDNIGQNEFDEQMSRYLSAGTYYVAVDAWDTPTRAAYTLDISTGSSSIDVCDWFSFSLPAQARVTIAVTGGPGFVLADAAMSSVLANGGAQGTSINLPAGTYLIGIGQGGAYTLDVTSP